MASEAAQFNCLAVETATEQASVALQFEGELSVRSLSQGRNSSRELYQAVREVLDAAGIKLRELDCIAFGHGPGSFTGVRVAASAAQSLSYTSQLPVCGVSTLAALAFGTEGAAGRVAAACLDARMSEVYTGVFRVVADGVEVLAADSLAQPSAYHVPAEITEFIAAGPGWSAYPELMENNGGRMSEQAFDVYPHAASVLRLSEPIWRSGEAKDAFSALPNYLRDDVAWKTSKTG